jgi:hypothetical protein
MRKVYSFGKDSAGRPVRLVVGESKWHISAGLAGDIDAAAAPADTRCTGAAAGPTRTDSNVGAMGAGTSGGGNAVRDKAWWIYGAEVAWDAWGVAAFLLLIAFGTSFLHLHGHAAGVRVGVLGTLLASCAGVFVESVCGAVSMARMDRQAQAIEAARGLDSSGGQR